MHGVQGYAGTAKTTTVLATYAAFAEREFKAVRALAPTASAAGTLGEALGVRGETVDKHLARQRAFDADRGDRKGPEQVWVVDEASMLSTSKTLSLMRAAERQGARLVLVGDVRQLGSVEEGAAFRQLQNAGMTTERLETIVRQSDEGMSQAVTLAAAGEAAEALLRFEQTGGRIVEANDAGERTAAMAAAWLALSAEERERTIVVDPSREGRGQANAAIREGLIAEGTLGRERVEGGTLVASALTKAERKQAQNYQRGMVVQFGRGLQLRDVSDGARRGSVAVLEKGGYAIVEAADRRTGEVRLAGPDGASLMWKPAQKGARDAAVYAVEGQELRSGDRITWTRNDADRGLVNGDRGHVEAVDEKAKTATVAFGSGEDKRVTLSLDRLPDRYWRHGYVETAHAAQGRTADRVIAHAEAWRVNLVNQASVYVALSRARREGIVVTDSREGLLKAVAGRAGLKETALSERAVQARAATLDDRPITTPIEARPVETTPGAEPARVGRVPDRLPERSGADPRPEDPRQREDRERREREAAEKRRTREVERRAKIGPRPRKSDRQPILPGLDPAPASAAKGDERPSAVAEQQFSQQATQTLPGTTPKPPTEHGQATASLRPAIEPNRADDRRPMDQSPTIKHAGSSTAGAKPENGKPRDHDRTAAADPAQMAQQRMGDAPAQRRADSTEAKQKETEKGWTPGQPIRSLDDLRQMAAHHARLEAQQEREMQQKGLDRDDGPSLDR